MGYIRGKTITNWEFYVKRGLNVYFHPRNVTGCTHHPSLHCNIFDEGTLQKILKVGLSISMARISYSKQCVKMRLLSSLPVICVALSLNPTQGFLTFSSSKSSSNGVRGLSATATATPKATAWSPTSWRDYPIKQPPNYPDEVRHNFTI